MTRWTTRLLAGAAAGTLAVFVFGGTASAESLPTDSGTCTTPTDTFDALVTPSGPGAPSLHITDTDDGSSYLFVASAVTVTVGGVEVPVAPDWLNAATGVDSSALGGQLTTCTFSEPAYDAVYVATGILAPTTPTE